MKMKMEEERGEGEATGEAFLFPGSVEVTDGGEWEKLPWALQGKGCFDLLDLLVKKEV